MAKTVVALFHDFDTAERAVRELENQGFSRDDVSLMSRDQTHYSKPGEKTAERGTHAGEGAAAGAGTGAVIGGIGGLLVGLGLLTIPGIGPILAAGPIATTLAGAGAGAAAGGIVGALTGAGVPKEEAHAFAEGVRRGGTLVMVRASENMASRAQDILNRFNPIDMHNESQTWRQKDNWQRFDESGQPYSEADMNRQRETWRSGSTAGYSSMGTGTAFGQGTTSGMSAERGYTSMRRDFNDYASDFRNDYSSYYADRGRDYSYYEPGYRYGYEIANNPDYRGQHWSQIEPQVRREWERTHPNNAWDDFKDSIRHAWERVTEG